MISIIIPLYKVEKYIESCLNSIANQTFQDFEVIVIDDGSPDGSVEKVENFIKENKINLKIIRQKNSGVSVARNTGIKCASGEYVCFVDSDDMLDKNYLAVLYESIDKNNGDICICKSRNISEDSDIIYESNLEYNTKISSKTTALESLLYGRLSAGIWAVLMRREILGDMKFAENYRYSEDLEMVWRLVASSKKIVCVDAPLYCYRIRGGSAMTVMNDKRLDGLRLFENLSGFIKENAPDFYPQYEKYGVARWIWSTVWQEAKASNSFLEFCERIQKYQASFYMKKLLTYKNALVVFSSFVFLFSKRAYFYGIRLYRKKYREIG